MTDFALQTSDDGSTDIVLFNGEFIADDSLRTAVAVSLLTDREWPEAPDGDRRGWWGDVFNVNPTDRIGCGWWRLARRKREPSVLGEARQFGQEALAWFIEDGIATAADVVPSYDSRGFLMADIALHRPQGIQRFRLAQLWQQSIGPSAIAKAEMAADEVAGLAGLFEYIYYVQYPELN